MYTNMKYPVIAHIRAINNKLLKNLCDSRIMMRAWFNSIIHQCGMLYVYFKLTLHFQYAILMCNHIIRIGSVFCMCMHVLTHPEIRRSAPKIIRIIQKLFGLSMPFWQITLI